METSGPAINESVCFMTQNLALFGHFGPELDIHEAGPDYLCICIYLICFPPRQIFEAHLKLYFSNVSTGRCSATSLTEALSQSFAFDFFSLNILALAGFYLRIFKSHLTPFYALHDGA
jgi:hypothetical protein